MQKDSKLFDDIARMASGAAGGLLGAKREIEAMVNSQLERIMLRMKLVTQEEFEVARDLAVNARAEQEKLSKRVEELEQRLAKLESGKKS